MKMPESVLPIFRALLFVFVLTGIAVLGNAQVNQGELEENLAPVTFINYEGPHARIETREQIRQIGAGLGQAISDGALRTGASNRYFVIHCVSGPESGKLDADIFGLGVDVGVDHIRNLRTIIQGYLQSAYGYNANDALLLAEYITIYNAVYRGDWDYFQSRYKTLVIENLNRERAGLSIRYDEWPGRTLMVIPLGHGGLSSIDTSTISDSRVVEEMRREDDRGVEQRRDMVNLMEREAEQAEQRAQVTRETIREEEQRIAQERQQVEQERREIVQQRQQTQEDQATGRITPEVAQQRQQELEQSEQAADDRTEQLVREEAALEERREEAQGLEDFAEQKTEDAQQMREGIAQDQQAVIIQDTAVGIIGVMIERQDSVMGRLVRIESATRRELRRSPLEVYARTVTFMNGRILAIAGENRGAGAVRLIEINSGSLEMARQGDDDMHPGSLLWVNGNDIYAITVNLADNSCYLGRFDTNLVLRAKSAITVHPDASVVIQQGFLLTQRADGSVAILNPADLTESM